MITASLSAICIVGLAYLWWSIRRLGTTPDTVSAAQMRKAYEYTWAKHPDGEDN